MQKAELAKEILGKYTNPVDLEQKQSDLHEAEKELERIRKSAEANAAKKKANMEGKAKVSLLEYQLTQPGTREQFAHLQKDGEWVERDDVWIKFLDRKGKLTPFAAQPPYQQFFSEIDGVSSLPPEDRSHLRPRGRQRKTPANNQ